MCERDPGPDRVPGKWRYAGTPSIPRSIDTLREYSDWIPMSIFTKDKLSGTWTVYFLEKRWRYRGEKVLSASSYSLMA